MDFDFYKGISTWIYIVKLDSRLGPFQSDRVLQSSWGSQYNLLHESLLGLLSNRPFANPHSRARLLQRKPVEPVRKLRKLFLKLATEIQILFPFRAHFNFHQSDQLNKHTELGRRLATSPSSSLSATHISGPIREDMEDELDDKGMILSTIWYDCKVNKNKFPSRIETPIDSDISHGIHWKLY